MNTKLLKIGCYVDVVIGVLGILCFILWAFIEEARKGEPLSKWIPALIVAILCVATGLLGLWLERAMKKAAPTQAQEDDTQAENN